MKDWYHNAGKSYKHESLRIVTHQKTGQCTQQLLIGPLKCTWVF